jgi:hypothetical protein
MCIAHACTVTKINSKPMDKMCQWDMDAPTLTYRQTGSRWLTDLKSAYTVQLIMLKLYAKYQIILPSRSCEVFDEIFWTDGWMYRRTLVQLNAPDCLLLKFSLNKMFIDPKSLN